MSIIMKKIIILTILIPFIFFTCALPHSNPVDPDYEANEEDTSNGGATSGPNIIFSKYTIYSDNNSDGIVNKGETVRVRVYLKNTGGTKANGVYATLLIATNEHYVTLTTYGGVTKAKFNAISAGSESSYGNAYNGGGYTESYYYSYEFRVDENTPDNHIITFTLSIIDEQGNTWTDTFTITVQQINANIKFSRYVIYSDDNSDGIVNKGETVRIRVYLKNTGSSKALNVYSDLTENSSYVTLTTYGGVTKAKFDDISAGSESSYGNAYNGGGYTESYYYSYEFRVDENTPDNHIITFTLSIIDEQGNTWIDTFTITVQPINATIIYSRHTIYYDSDGDGIVEAGETVRIRVYLKNTGSSKALNVYSDLTENSSYVTLTTYGGVTKAKFNDISAGSESYYGYAYNGGGYTEASYYSYEFQVSSSAPTGHIITFTLSIVDEFNNTWSDTFTITVQ